MWLIGQGGGGRGLCVTAGGRVHCSQCAFQFCTVYISGVV